MTSVTPQTIGQHLRAPRLTARRAIPATTCAARNERKDPQCQKATRHVSSL